MIFESHAHYDDIAFDKDRDKILKSMKEHGVGMIMNISSDFPSIETTLLLIEKFPFIYGAIGVHPCDCKCLTEEKIQWIKEKCKSKKVKAIGEIGLDYYWKETDKDIQKRWFIRQLELAREEGLPVIIHSRDGAEDTLRILKEQKACEIGGVVHCFSYGKEIAEQFLNMGFYFGIGGVLTFPNSKKIKEVVKWLPIERILLETDSPYLTPVPHRGKRNTSYNLVYVAEEISRQKNMTLEEVIEMTERNAKKLFFSQERHG